MFLKKKFLRGLKNRNLRGYQYVFWFKNYLVYSLKLFVRLLWLVLNGYLDDNNSVIIYISTQFLICCKILSKNSILKENKI